ncbi:cysteine peptidase family C39 domain-containing protein [Siccirubricoccus deserti]
MIEGLLDFGGRRRLPSILQTEAAECGLACLAMIASYHGHRIDLNTLRRRHPVSLRGVTLRGLIQLASQLHLASRPVRYELEDIRELTLPAIVHWDLNHFVVLKAVTAKGVVVHDPATGVKTLTLETASKHLTGIALELSPAEGFAPKQERRGCRSGCSGRRCRGCPRRWRRSFAFGDPRTAGGRRALLHAVDGG